MDNMTFHETDERLELYTLSRLPEADTASVEEHLLICDVCREKLDEIAEFALAMREALKTQPAAESAREWFGAGWFGWMKPQFAMAGAFAAVVLAVGIFWVAGSGRVAPVASLQLSAMRGSEVKSAKAAKELDLSFINAPGVSRVDVVDESGAGVWSGIPEPDNTAAHGTEAKIRRTLSPGRYLARTYAASGQLLHEYEFRIEK